MSGSSQQIIEVDVEYRRRVNLAEDSQVVKLVQLHNRTDAPLLGLSLELRVEPGRSRFMREGLSIAPGATRNIDDIELLLDHELVETIETHRVVELSLNVALSGQNGKPTSLLEGRYPLEIVPATFWTGLTGPPETLAGFSFPEHSDVEKLVQRVRAALDAATGDPSWPSARRRDPRRVRQVVAAIFQVLQTLDIRTAPIEPDFTTLGAAIKLPDQIISERSGTVLDISLLIAAAIEHIGLDPIIVLTEAHVLVGAWLIGERFHQPTIDDHLRVRKRVEVGDVCLVDPTALDILPKAPFEQAETGGASSLREKGFHCLIDMSAARERHIVPHELASPGRREAGLDVLEPRGLGVPDLPTGPVPGRPQTGATPHRDDERTDPSVLRLERWKASLLDLSLRNRLISYRETKKSVPLVCSDLPGLEDALAEGTVFELWPTAETKKQVMGSERGAGDVDAEFLTRELSARRLHTTIGEVELRKRLVDIYRAARRDLEEGGSNTLYLAIGFLAWYETPTSEKRRLAPLLLYPMELVRGTAREPFKLRRAPDEVRVNISLLHKLAREFEIDTAGLDELTEDDSGLDINLIFQRFRRSIVDVDRFEVLEESVLGLFSFSKFVMWRDLEDRSSSLMEHELVRHVVNGGAEPWPHDFKPGDLDTLDEKVPPSKSFTVMDADASQLAAVALGVSQNGHSFVLEGPPGTGKSQTITNLIAQCLAQGQTVLFVSEKMAALNVVRARLDRVGLGDYCLELHSNKARKADVVSQLGRTLEGVGANQPEDWTSSAAQLKALRDELNEYARALHSSRQIGETLFQVTSRLIGLRDAELRTIDLGRPEDMSAQRVGALREVWKRYTSASTSISPVSNHAFRAARRSDFQPTLSKDLRDEARAVELTTQRLEVASDDLCRALEMKDRAPLTMRELGALDELAEKMLESPGPPMALLEDTNWEGGQSEINEWVGHGLNREELREQLSEHFDPDRLILLNLDALRARFLRWATTFFLIAWIMLFSARWMLKDVLADGERRVPPSRQIPADLDRALKLREEEQTLKNLDDRAKSRLAHFWKGASSDWGQIQGIVEWCRDFRRLMKILIPSGSPDASVATERINDLVSQPSVSLVPGASHTGFLVKYREAWEAHSAAKGRIAELLLLDEGIAWGEIDSPGYCDRVRARLERWVSEADSLRDYCAFLRAEEAVRREGLGAVSRAHREGAIECDVIEAAFERSFYEWWWSKTIAGDERLAQFHGADHQHTIERFRVLDCAFLELAKQLVRGRLEDAVKAVVAGDAFSSELQVLRREVKKKRRHLPLRSLFQKIPGILPRLAPCLLMSPLSVAQYLDPSHPLCDLVVFDEASQIPVWDGIGAVARGERCVIVGDSQQLPPTSFFKVGGGADDDLPPLDDEFEELESILDECVAAGLPQHRLLWHYRSRHEELITFSNYHYYDNSLMTFPCAEAGRDDLGVCLRPVPEGFYDRSKTRTNRAEAEAVVAEIVGQLTDADERQRSIGVVTFSQAQQTLIEDLLDEERRQRPEIERAFSSEVEEPLFVKNLENVQGDERDVMLFSICYGPDTTGKVSMNFGPLNRRGGQRRLNVAITRAREQLLVFATLRPDQIDLTRTSSEAVRHLRTFLEFAARGSRAIDEAVTSVQEQGAFDSSFEKSVALAIREMGYEVHEQVGCSGYRIDLAVVDPKRPERYLLGVECDGANYAAASTARDRDRLRAAVLEKLGWSLHRMWSMDFWLDPRGQIAALKRAIRGSVDSLISGR